MRVERIRDFDELGVIGVVTLKIVVGDFL